MAALVAGIGSAISRSKRLTVTADTPARADSSRTVQRVMARAARHWTAVIMPALKTIQWRTGNLRLLGEI
jgi:hypothetical protein